MSKEWRRRTALARGHALRPAVLRLNVDLDKDTMGELRAEATRRSLTVAATVRLMVEWGLEAAKAEWGKEKV